MYHLGQAQLALGRSGEAVVTIEEAIRHHRTAAAGTPQFAKFRRSLVDDYFALARAQRARSRPAEALAAARAGLDLAPDDASLRGLRMDLEFPAQPFAGHE
jgi:hypothetical protein